MSVLSYYKSSSPHRYVVNYSTNSIRRGDGQRVEEKVDKSNDYVVIDIIDEDSDRSQFGDEEKLCRICYESSKSSQLIELGCDCRGEIGFAHRKCAAIWFSYKGNKICEICGKKAKNASSSSNKNNVTVTTSTTTTMPAVRN